MTGDVGRQGRQMTRLLLWLPASAALLVVAACGSPAGKPPTPAPVIAVRTVPAAMKDMADRLEAGGVVAASESAVVSSRILAPVMTVHVRAGDPVHAGDLLVALDARDVAAHVRQAQAEVVTAERRLAQARDEENAATAELKLASAWHSRIAELRAKNSATVQEFDEAEARLSAATARSGAMHSGVEEAASRIVALRAAADAAAITESFASVRSPFDGVVTERLTDPGNLAAPGTPLLRIDAGGGLRVDVRVDEARTPFVRIGDRVAVVLDDYSGATGAREVEGRIVEVARAISADLRAFTVKVALPRDASPVSGRFARVRFRGAVRKALTVPADAVRRQGQMASVFVVQGGVARLRLIQTGIRDADDVEVLAGLDPNESVITAPPAAVTDGRRVTTGSTGLQGAQP